MNLAGLILAAGLLGGFGPGDPAVVVEQIHYLPRPDEPNVPELFRLGPADYAVEREPALEEDGLKVSKVRFPSPVTTPDPANNTVYCEYFTLGPFDGKKRPSVVVLHILGADFALSRYYAIRLAREGVNALFLKLPYYGERRGNDRERRFLSGEVDRTTMAMGQGICDIRRAADWLARQPEADPDRLGVTGISLGGITSALAVSVDPRINRATLILAGGDLGEILWTMDEPGADRWRQIWKESGKTRADLDRLTRPFDPLTYARPDPTKKILMFAGNTDEVIPPESARKLWAAFGRPPIEWLDCGHYSSAGFMLPMFRRSATFLKSD